ncbi:protein translocase subunit SecD [Hydrogenophilus thiooxidans]|uniref:protein translocase subunit SecD n=1 Tax=Hydrogenophilus thiooxidans TaxID=2820326 RepID=UPI001C24865F|nr:protein translocase subunit SecD [Hydrogenophilus thiooxidans]
MNRYPLWKSVLIVLVVIVGAIYALPNLFGEIPAVQVAPIKAGAPWDAAPVEARIRETLASAHLEATGFERDPDGLRILFAETETQLKARDLIDAALNPDPKKPRYIVALNLLPGAPKWLLAIGAKPMYLGLDLRGGVHFLLEVDMAGAIAQRLDALAADIRSTLRSERIRSLGIARQGNTIVARFSDPTTAQQARTVLTKTFLELAIDLQENGDETRLIARLTPSAEQKIREFALKQNITTLHNRINELGVAEPVIQQQGANRIVVQLPGVQDVAKAKDILGRTATLEVRLVDDTPGALEAALAGRVPPGTELLTERNGRPILVKRDVVLTGERLTDAQPGFDSQTQEPAVHLTLDAAGARIFRDVTRENVGKRMAILLIDRGVAEVVTAPVIRTEIGGGRVQISGAMTTAEARDIALLLRAGSLAAPMRIVEERTIGPSLGKENIERGVNATLYGFLAIALFMIVYYEVIGIVSVVALFVNLVLLIALLSLLQATLTLPGIAAVALTLGMAIDANVLINERIREELRAGVSPQLAIAAGYDRAFDTILDSNVTSLIAGLALLIFGWGPVRGFAVVHVLGILTSIFSAVLVSRWLVNLIYGGNKRISRIRIG